MNLWRNQVLKEIKIEGFKSIKKVSLALPPLTLLCGLNNSGKSSIIQSLRMFCKSADGNSPYLSGHGDFDEIRSRLVSTKDAIKVSCNFDDNSLSTLTIYNNSFIKPRKSPLSCYISADRWGPKISLPLDRHIGEFPSIGSHGEYVIGFLNELRNQIIPDILRHQDSQGTTLEYQIVGWLKEIAPDIEISYETDSKRDASHVEFNSFRPTNVGYGLSYCLPIFAAILGMASTKPTGGWDVINGEKWQRQKKHRGILIMIENPEAHLHPSGQTALGKLIAIGAQCGLQLVIETQSDHLMDGIRIAIKDKFITPDKVAFHYLSKNQEGETVIETPKLNKDGKLEYWPKGFFDQTLKNRAKLART